MRSRLPWLAPVPTDITFQKSSFGCIAFYSNLVFYFYFCVFVTFSYYKGNILKILENRKFTNRLNHSTLPGHRPPPLPVSRGLAPTFSLRLDKIGSTEILNTIHS